MFKGKNRNINFKKKVVYNIFEWALEEVNLFSILFLSKIKMLYFLMYKKNPSLCIRLYEILNHEKDHGFLEYVYIKVSKSGGDFTLSWMSVRASAVCHRWQRLQTTACRNVTPQPLYKLLEPVILFTSSGPQMFVIMFLRAWPKLCAATISHRLNWRRHLVSGFSSAYINSTASSNLPCFRNRRSRRKSSLFLVDSALIRLYGLFPI